MDKRHIVSEKVDTEPDDKMYWLVENLAGASMVMMFMMLIIAFLLALGAGILFFLQSVASIL